MLNLIALALIVLQTSVGFSQTTAEIASKFPTEFRSILIDARNNRFGAGDVAASYLTIVDLIRTYKVSEKINILTNDESGKILRRIAHGNDEFFSHVNIYGLKTLPTDTTFDLYLSFANKNGEFSNQIDFNERFPDRLIHLAPDAVLITQPVLGNTENKLFARHLQHATLRYRGRDYSMSYPGLAETDAGVYDDFVAKILRAASTLETTRYLLEQMRLVDDPFSKSALTGLLDGSKLQGAKVGVAYGLSSAQTQQPQFVTYLQGLARSTDASFCFVMPASVDPQSGFTPSAIDDPLLRERIVFVNSPESMPSRAKPGKIYLVQTKNLPHSVFVGLMAYSMKNGLVPVGAGDGFLSAALNLGGPFVLTRVRWNAKNIINFKDRLVEAAKKRINDIEQLEQALKLIEEVFGTIDFQHAQDLQKLTGIFSDVGRQTPSFTARIINAAYLARHASTTTSGNFLDARLRESFAPTSHVPMSCAETARAN